VRALEASPAFTITGRKLKQPGTETIGIDEYALRNDDATLVYAAMALRYLLGANDAPVVA
jgi:hypothetical protein